MLIGVNLTRNGRLETASTQTKPAEAGFKSLIFRQSAWCANANSVSLAQPLVEKSCAAQAR
jgi:hypothetical protein